MRSLRTALAGCAHDGNPIYLDTPNNKLLYHTVPYYTKFLNVILHATFQRFPDALLAGLSRGSHTAVGSENANRARAQRAHYA